MKNYSKIILFLLFTSSILIGQEKIKQSLQQYHSYLYEFILMDSPHMLFTMRQMNTNYISTFRLFAKGISEVVSTKKRNKLGFNNEAALIQMAVLIFAMPITHEEGHRSILTAKNIGSISKPYMNSKGAAYVVGVRDIELKNLRDTDLPNYIRLHTAGLESDYMLTRRVETLIAFEEENFENIMWEYYNRKVAILQYYVLGLFKLDIGIKEEKNELDRDIVGHDIYGFARHIYRPTMDFHRYTDYKDLTTNEKNLVKRLGYRSILNLLNPQIIGKRNFNLSERIKGNFGLGYTMAPFGDFIDENIWLRLDNKYNIHLYGRQFQNESNWFYGFGLSLNNFAVTDKFSATIKTHFWTQPKELDFFTKESFSGGAIDLSLSYNLFRKQDKWLKGFGLSLGLIFKSYGFLPEEVMLDEHLGFRIGTILEF